MKKLVDVYPYQKRGDSLFVLLLKRSKAKIYAGQWRMIGGKVEPDETRWQTALRELKEETTLTPDLFWSVPTVNHFYEPESDRIYLIPAFAAEIRQDSSIRLDEEHDSYRWVHADNIDSFIVWPEQKRIIACIKTLVTREQILQDWIINYEQP